MIYTDFLQKFEVVVEIPQTFLFNLSLSIVKKPETENSLDDEVHFVLDQYA